MRIKIKNKNNIEQNKKSIDREKDKANEIHTYLYLGLNKRKFIVRTKFETNQKPKKKHSFCENC